MKERKNGRDPAAGADLSGLSPAKKDEGKLKENKNAKGRNASAFF